jgi:threonine-phosphate decarboxylase
MTEHGGNIYSFAKKNGVDEREILDFSASINPLGLPDSVISEIRNIDSSMYHYPDPDSGRLKQTISIYYGIKQESVICGNGSTELIYLCARAFKPKKVLIPSPTFSEYERASLLTGAEIKYHKLKEENYFDLEHEEFIKDLKGCDMAFICNPNNPTGRHISKELMLKLAKSARESKCYLVVDEAFIDFIPENSLIHEAENNPFLIVLRSMTKFYALSAFRLGFGVFHQSLIRNILKNKEPWTVNTFAQIAGIAALRDKEYTEKTFQIITDCKKLMKEGFERLSLEYLASAVNYYLLKIKNAQQAIKSLQSSNIMVRDCSNFKGLNGSYIRVAVKSKEDNLRLLKGLENICAQ